MVGWKVFPCISIDELITANEEDWRFPAVDFHGKKPAHINELGDTMLRHTPHPPL
jgi:hypothetical protein